MTNIVVVFPRVEDAKNVKNLLVRNGYRVAAVCTTAAQAIHCADGLVNGVMIAAYKLPDMMYRELKEYLPSGFELVVLVSRNHLEECRGVITVPMPFTVRDLLNTLNMVSQNVSRRKKNRKPGALERSEEDRRLLDEVKADLMLRNHMTEAEAHRYLQKLSMESGNSLVETAQMLLTINKE